MPEFCNYREVYSANLPEDGAFTKKSTNGVYHEAVQLNK